MSDSDNDNDTAPDQRSDTETFIIGVGASAGGLEALQTFFEQIPADCPHCFVVVQHLSPNHESMMVEILGRSTALTVQNIQDDSPFAPGCVMVLPPGKNVLIQDNHLRLTAKKTGINLPIDLLFNSLAEQAGERAIGIVLSGSGSDGARGVRTIKSAGGMVMVQSPEQAKFDGMPMSSIHTGVVDFVLPANELPLALLSFIRKFYTPDRRTIIAAQPTHSPNSSIQRVLTLVQRASGVDFRPYKPTMIGRRIERRMAINECTNVDDYLALLYQQPQEINALTNDFLIGVTHFFRDPEAWEVLQKQVFPVLVAQKKARPGEPIRVWSSGCSTGEEAYTAGILLLEEIARQHAPIELKIFGSDLMRSSLDTASRGLYPGSIDLQIPALFLNRYFHREGADFRVVESLRNVMFFSPHDLLRDPPFGRLDLVICRNLLIYLNQEAQQRALRILRYSLRLNGVMFLGSSETHGLQPSEFETIHEPSRIYRNVQRIRRIDDTSVPPYQPARESNSPRVPRDNATSVGPLMQTMTEVLGFVVIYVDSELGITQAHGEFSKYAVLPDIGFSTSLLKITPPQLAAAIRRAVRTVSDGKESEESDVEFTIDGHHQTVNIVVRSLHEAPTTGATYMIILRPSLRARSAAPDAPATPTPQWLDLENELERVKDELRDAREDASETHEELQSANEELQSANEELQSINEELQSINEELHSVNAEHQKKIKDLAAANAEFESLMTSTQIGTMFVDNNMCIRKFTPAITDLFSLTDADIGRPLRHFTTTLIGGPKDETIQAALSVIREETARTDEVADEAGRHFLRRIHPLVPAHAQAVDGVVISFVDVTKSKLEEQRLRADIDRMNHTLSAAQIACWSVEPGRDVVLTDSLARLLGYDIGPGQAKSLPLERLLHPEDTEAQERWAALFAGSQQHYVDDFRMVRANKEPIRLSHRGVVTRTEDSAPPLLQIYSQATP